MIYINSHEPKEMINLLSSLLNSKNSNLENPKDFLKIENFSPGDYIINDIAIERKTLNDFFNSLVSKRLFRQLSELKHCYSKPVLLLENFDLSFIKKTNVFYSVLIKILFNLNIKIIFSRSIEDSAKILYLLYKRKDKKGVSMVLPLYRAFRVKGCIEKERLAILSSVCNIGTKRARALLSEFKTVKNIINAEEEKILSVTGIGKDTVKNLKSI